MLSLTSLFRRVKKPAKNFGRAFHFFNSGHADGQSYEMIPGAGVAVSKAWMDGWRWRVTILVVLQVALGLTRDNGTATGPDSAAAENTRPALRVISLRFVALEALKFFCCGVLAYFETRRSSQSGQNSPRSVLDAEPLREEEGWQSEPGGTSVPSNSDRKPLVPGTTRSTIVIGILALLLVAHSYLTEFIIISGVPNIFVIHLSILFVPLFSAIFLRLFGVWNGSSQQWLGILLQILGLLSFESESSLPSISSSSTVFLISLALLASLVYISAQHVFRRHDVIPHKFNTRLFAYGLIFHVIALVLSNLFFFEPTVTSSGGRSTRTLIALIFRTSADIIGLNVVIEHGPVLFGVSTSLSMTCLLFAKLFSGPLTAGELCSLAVALLGFCGFWIGELHQRGVTESPRQTRSEGKTLSSRVLFPATLFLMLGTAAYVGSDVPVGVVEVASHEAAFLNTKEPIATTESLVFADLPYIPPPPLPPPEPVCIRVPLPSEQFFTGNRTYHEFDDVLLIVFFSHARYDVNLDYYREVYSEFFPNMVFVGPKNREDKGFEHSYDVLVDSYESEEDISDWNDYKMAGRMAHHMLYTVLTSPPYASNCYKGYLWAPFDTLLNIPRLQLFDQDRIWYFSPWGEYVPNPAVDEETWRNASNHAPPARISPDPETDFEKTYRGWWVDWWWGDPHYGIPVCKSAFDQVPLELRERMSNRFTRNETRYIGGSADTLYVPARLADPFVDLLGTFLNTTCFLEIAVPTVVHLLVPEGEDILFVDHWWIWEPPFNASFVRDRWQRGMEVDTFHTFHWGDKDSDGVWRANPDNIDDVRKLLRESAVRQGVEWLS